MPVPTQWEDSYSVVRSRLPTVLATRLEALLSEHASEVEAHAQLVEAAAAAEAAQMAVEGSGADGSLSVAAGDGGGAVGGLQMGGVVPSVASSMVALPLPSHFPAAELEVCMNDALEVRGLA